MTGTPDRIVAAVAVALFVSVAPASAQEGRPLTLREAVAEALEGNAVLSEAELGVRAADAGARSASAFLWPSVALDAGVLRTDDPVGVFGTKLRQGRFSQQDLALDALNQPDPVTDWTAGAGASWSVVDPARWSGREAARLEATAAARQTDRTREAVVFRTKALYFEAARTEGRLQAARRALEAARATTERIRRRRDQGLLTDAHLLQARAELEGARAELTQAELARTNARTDLAVHLGWPSDQVPVPVDTASSPEEPPLPGAPADVEGRSDLKALEARVAAAEAQESRAFRSRLPALEGFAQVSTHARDFTGSREESWTAGVRLRVPVFTGWALSAERQAAEARREAAGTRLAQARREARAQLRAAAGSVGSARQALAASRAAADAAREGSRLMARRFEEGMATTAELLQAQARTARMESRAVDALAAYRTALARLEFAAGRATEDLTSDPSRDR